MRILLPIPPAMVRSRPAIASLRRACPATLILVTVFALVLSLLAYLDASAQTLTSDQADYPPGTIATLTGAGFTPGEQVMVQVLHADGRVDTREDHLSWSVVADQFGEFVTTWDVCTSATDCVGETFRATADGVSSGLHAECLFTDATAWAMTITPASSAISQTQTYTLKALNTSTGSGNQMGCITITIPSAFTPSGSPSVVPGSTTHAWTVTRSGQVITATANSNGDRVSVGESIQFSMAATAPASTTGSPFPWTSIARTNTNCSGASFGIPDGGQPTVAVTCTPAAITCPANITVNNAPGLCAATVGFAATATGSPAPTVTYTKDPGTSFPVGTTTVTATATNSCGTANCSFTVTVVDNTPPTITLAGANPITVECHTNFTDPGASATDNCPGSLPIAVSGAVNVNAVGSYTLTYSTTDANGNPASKTRTVNVVDTTHPTVALTGASTLTVECHTAFTDPGATASDACAGSLVPTVTGSANANVVGDYVLTYTVTDPSGNSDSKTRTVHVTDTTKPVVALVGGDMTLECHGPAFADPGSSADDSCAGALTVSVTGSVDVNTVGDYVLTYSAVDPSGNSDSKTRTVHVTDTTKPVVALVGGDMTLECHGPAFVDPGSSADDTCAGPLAVNVTGSVDVNTVGDYVLTYTATDPSGNSDSKTRTVHVTDTTKPVVALVGGDMTLECHGPTFADPGSSASDACAGSLPVTVTGSVNVNTVGSYVLTYNAADPSGNGDSKTRTVNVVDTTPPVISAAGADATIQCPNAPTFTAPTTIDACDDGAQIVELSDVTVSGACAGTYERTKTWKAVDASGNSSATVSQAITIVDTTPPTISAPGANGTISCPATPVFTAPTASDGCNNAATVIEVSDVTTPGACSSAYSRTKTWRAKDCSGNLSPLVSQTISVVDVVAPTAAITAPSNGTVVSVGIPVTFKANVGDACGVQSAQWQFDSLVLPAEAIAGGIVSTTYTFLQAGVYQVKLSVKDACGNTTTATQTPDGFAWTIIVYDPNGGFVTGGGWINSPPGAYRPSPALVGKANFGFVSKYQKGAKVPTGETEFQFKTGDLNFHSSAYEWLVIGGTKAQYKGTGTLNGVAGYGFLLTGVDGDQLGGSQPDRFRIKIWSVSSGDVVYDNQNGQLEDSDAASVLGGGSIELQSGGAGGKGNTLTTASAGTVAPVPTGTIPLQFTLRGAQPNPFAGNTEIGFDLPEVSEVSLLVFDVRGRRVATVTSGRVGAGSHFSHWNGRGDNGAELKSGIYFVRFIAQSAVSTRRLESVKKILLER